MLPKRFRYSQKKERTTFPVVQRRMLQERHRRLREETYTMARTDFTLHWQPILYVDRPSGTPPLTIVAGQLQVRPTAGQDLDALWTQAIAESRDQTLQAEIETGLWPYLREMQRAFQWHIPLHSQVPPSTRAWLPFWRDEGIAFNLVYELPVDEPISPEVWTEIELIRRGPQLGRRQPALAGTHVGRHGLTPALAETLNTSPFDVLLLDPQVVAGLSAQIDPAHDSVAPLMALREFVEAVRPDLPVVVTGIETPTQWQAASLAGVVYAQGGLWMPPTPLAATFTSHTPDTDPDWFPDKVYQTAEGWVAARGMQFERESS